MFLPFQPPPVVSQAPPPFWDPYEKLLGFFRDHPQLPKGWEGFWGSGEFIIEAEFANGKILKWKPISPYSKYVTAEWLSQLMLKRIDSYDGRLDKPIKGRFVLLISNCALGGPMGVGIYPEFYDVAPAP